MRLKNNMENEVFSVIAGEASYLEFDLLVDGINYYLLVIVTNEFTRVELFQISEDEDNFWKSEEDKCIEVQYVGGTLYDIGTELCIVDNWSDEKAIEVTQEIVEQIEEDLF